MDELTPWHRLFGLHWVDFFHGLPVHVEMEKDLSLKQQLLDLVIIRKETAILPRRLPDGFEDLAHHNLITFKSYQDTLDGWALNELIGHYVNYRKQCSPSMQDLLAETDFRLFAVCVRFPQSLSQQVELRPIQPGVYEVRHYSGSLRLIVVHQLAQEEHNAMLHLFSARTELLKYGTENYRLQSRESSTLLYRLFERYRLEVPVMPDLMQEFVRETIDHMLRKLSPEERLRGLSIEERLQGLPAEERLKGLPAEERLKGLPAEERLKGLSTDDLLKGLSPEAREALVRRLRDGSGSSS